MLQFSSALALCSQGAVGVLGVHSSFSLSACVCVRVCVYVLSTCTGGAAGVPAQHGWNSHLRSVQGGPVFLFALHSINQLQQYSHSHHATCLTHVFTTMGTCVVVLVVSSSIPSCCCWGCYRGQGAAASMLACCKHDEELAWLAATGIVPLVAMVNTGSKYAQEWALQVMQLHQHTM